MNFLLEGLIKFEKIFSKHSESKNDAIFDGGKKLKLGESLEMMCQASDQQLAIFITIDVDHIQNNHDDK